MEKYKCCLCKKEFEGYGNNAEPIKIGKCCDDCNIKIVLPTRLITHLVEKELEDITLFRNQVLTSLVHTRGINKTITSNKDFIEEVFQALKKYVSCDWGDICKEDWELNDLSFKHGEDRIVAKYKTSKGDIFIITEADRGVTTILFTHEY